MTSPWAVNPLGELIIPGDAGPGDSRIVITTQLPPPLDTYTFVDQAGYSDRYTAAIIFYPDDPDVPPDDNTYTYLATVGNPVGSVFSAVHMGHVSSGSVRQVSPGVPEVQIWGTESSSVATQKWLTGGLVEIMATQLTGYLRMRAVDDIRMDLTGTSGVIGINATTTGSQVVISGATKVQMQDALNNARVFVDTTNVEGFSFGDTRWQGFGHFIINMSGEVRLKATRAYLLTQIQTNLATAPDVTLTAVSQNIPGCSITLPTVTANARYDAIIVCDFEMTVVGSTTAIGRLSVDGVVQTQEAHLELTTTSVRATVSQVYSGTLAAAGNHTFILQALLSAASGTTLLKASHSTLKVQIFESG